MSAWKNLTFSGLERQVMILHCVKDSDALLSPADRMNCINELLEVTGKLNPEIIEEYCQSVANQRLEYNMVNARVVSEYYRN